MYHVTFNPDFFDLDNLPDVWDCDLDLSHDDEAVVIERTCSSEENCLLTYVGESGAPREFGILRVGRFEDESGDVVAVMINIEEI